MTTPPAGSPPTDPTDPAGTTATHGGAPHEGPRVGGEQMRDIAAVRRSVADRKVGGVAAGLARHLDIDPVILRVGFVVLSFFGGAGVLLYAGLWALVPEEGQDRPALALDTRARTIGIVGVGVVAALALLGDVLGGAWLPDAWPLAVIALIVAVVVMRRDRPSSSIAPTSATDPGGGATGRATGVPADPYGPVDPATRQSLAGADWPPGPAPAPPTRNPRRRGPLLFWSTCALLMLALGLLGAADLAGMEVAGSAYPALALAIIGGMLVLGAFWGRAGGLILLGLIAAVALAGSSAAERWDGGDSRTVRPATASAVASSYSINAGELVVDLSRVADPAELDGESLLVEAGMGRIEVILPAALDVEVTGEAGLGQVGLDGTVEGGPGVELRDRHEGSLDAELDVEAQIGLGEIEVSYR